ncbi:MAG: SBBP repeat-containing protein, partial [Thermoplasmata archaeon]|nr:SBBP repeat-containing protein [Thermoplasmata archaeon]
MVGISGQGGSYFTQNDGQWDDAFTLIGSTDFGHVGLGVSAMYYNLINPPVEGVLPDDGHHEGPEDGPEDQNMISDGGHVLQFTFDGSNYVEPTGFGMLSHKNNYFIGNEESEWRSGVSNYEGAKYENLWNGVDLIYKTTADGAKYEFVVAPNTDPSSIVIHVAGHQALTIRDGDLTIALTDEKEILDSDLLIFYDDGPGERINGRFRVLDGSTYTFELEDYDRSRGIVIDPLVYSTFLGGTSSDYNRGIAVDDDGDAYVTGYTQSTNFPITSGAYDSSKYGSYDAYITRLNSSGTALVYSTYIGGSNNDYGYSLAIDGEKNAHILIGVYSSTYNLVPGSYNFPMVNSYDSTFNGYYYDIVLAKLNPSGSSLLYSTYWGGNNYDYGYGIDVDSDGYTYMCGYTRSTNFPTKNALQSSMARTSYYDGVVGKFDTTSSGSSSLIYSTYLGGYYYDYIYDISADSNGRAYVVGYYSSSSTATPRYPTTSNAYRTSSAGGSDVVFSVLSSSGSSLVYSTFIGGSSSDYGYGIDVDDEDCAYLTGRTYSSNWPVSTGAYQINRHGYSDLFVVKIDPDLSGASSLIYSTYLGG